MSAAMTWGEEVRNARRIIRKRRIIRRTALTVGAFFMFSAGVLFERLAG